MSDDYDSLAGLLFRSGVFVFFGWIIDRGVRFGGRVIIARGFGKVDYGNIALGATILAMGSTVALLGLHAGVSRYLPRDDSVEFKRGVILSATQIVLPAALVIGALLTTFAEPLAVIFFGSRTQAHLLRVFAFGIPFATFVKLTIDVIRGQQRSNAKIALENITVPVVQFFGIAVALTLGLGRVAVAWVYTVSYGAAALLAIYYLRRYTPLFKPADATYIRRELLKFSVPMLFTSVMFMLLSDIDTAMLGYFDTPSVIAEYNVAYPLSFLLVAILESLAFLFIPVLSRLHSDRHLEEMNNMYQLLTKWIIFLTTPAFLLFISYPEKIILITFGETYVAAATAMIILSTGFFVRTITGPNGATITAIGRTKLHLYDTSAVTMLNIVLNLILIPRYSYVGAAVATAVCYIALNVIYSYQVYAELGIVPVSNRTLRPLLGLFGISTVAYVFSGIPSALWEYFALFAGYGVAFVCVLVFFRGIGSDEALLLNNIEERFGIDLTFLRRLVN